MKQFQQYKNLLKTIPDLGKTYYHLVHYMRMMNESKTGCYFVYNMDMLLFNIALFKRTLKASTKKSEDVLYYPFNQDAFVTLRTKPVFLDFKNNSKIEEEVSNFNTEKLFKSLNNNFTKLKTNKHTKEEIVTIFQYLENTLLVLIKAYSEYLKQYEAQFKN